MTEKQKVFCIGFQKTGTSSLRRALVDLGYSVGGYFDFTDLSTDEGLTREKLWARVKDLVATRFDAVQDTPYPIFYRELDEAFPGSKFIHVVRDSEKWYDSAAADFGAWPNQLHQLIYGAPAPVGHKDIWISRYEIHNRDVADYFKDRPDDFISLNLSKGEVDWAPICAFLGVPAPGKPWPHANTRAEKKRMLFFDRLKKRLGLKK